MIFPSERIRAERAGSRPPAAGLGETSRHPTAAHGSLSAPLNS